MRRAYMVLLAGTLVGGCVTMPPGWHGNAKQPATAAATPAPKQNARPIQAEDVTDGNAHRVARELRREMDREEADSVQPVAPVR